MQCDLAQQYVYDAFNALVNLQALFTGVQCIFNLLKLGGESHCSENFNFNFNFVYLVNQWCSAV
jgi:hypothetical protein